MSYSNRNSIVVAWIAFGLLVAAIVAWASWDWSEYLTEERVRADKTAEYHDGYAEERINEECLSLEPIPMRDCIHKEIEAARDHERSEQDLDAQQAMARFTRLMGWTTVAGLALGVVSIFVIFFTFREMGRTNQIMRDEQRPWMRVVAPSITLTTGGDGAAQGVINTTTTNYGKSLARNVHIRARASTGPYNRDEVRLGMLREAPNYNGDTHFPNDPFTCGFGVDLTGVDFEKWKIEAPRTSLTVCVLCTYQFEGKKGVFFDCYSFFGSETWIDAAINKTPQAKVVATSNGLDMRRSYVE